MRDDTLGKHTFTLGHRVQRLLSISMANGIRGAGHQKTRKLATSYVTVESPVRRIEAAAAKDETGSGNGVGAAASSARPERAQLGKQTGGRVPAASEANDLFWQDAMALPCFASEF